MKTEGRLAEMKKGKGSEGTGRRQVRIRGVTIVKLYYVHI